LPVSTAGDAPMEGAYSPDHPILAGLCWTEGIELPILCWTEGIELPILQREFSSAHEIRSSKTGLCATESSFNQL